MIGIGRDIRGVTWTNTLFKADLKGTHKDDGANCFQNRTSKETFIGLQEQSCLRILLHVFVSFLPECLLLLHRIISHSCFFLIKSSFLGAYSASFHQEDIYGIPVKHMTSKYMISSYTSELKAFRGCCKQTNRHACVPMHPATLAYLKEPHLEV